MFKKNINKTDKPEMNTDMKPASEVSGSVSPPGTDIATTTVITLDELYDMVMSNREIMGEFVKASGTDSLSAFAGSYGCSASDEEIRRFFIMKCEGEISDDEVSSVAGGAAYFGRWVSNMFRSATDVTRSGSRAAGKGIVPAAKKAPTDIICKKL